MDDPVATSASEASPASRPEAPAQRNSMTSTAGVVGRIFSWWGSSSSSAPENKAQAATKMTPVAGAVDADEQNGTSSSKRANAAKPLLPDATAVPVPEAAVAALGDTAGQLFVAPPSPTGKNGGDSSGDSNHSVESPSDGKPSNGSSSSSGNGNGGGGGLLGRGSRSGGGRGSSSRRHRQEEATYNHHHQVGEEEDMDDIEPRLSEAVTLSDFDRIKVLGKGSFGKVVLVERKDRPGTRYAMKVLKKSKLRRVKQVERTKTERRVLEVCKLHPFIMSMSYAFQTEEKLYLVLEYCSGGELFFHLSRFRKFPEHVARFYAAELALAIAFLHQNGVIYRDMKPENVLLDSEGHVKLGDFGLAKDNIWDPCQGARSICGTPEYMAPEVLNKVGHGHAVDWWGLGMILYEMLTGLPPWYTKDRQKLFQRLRYAPLRIPPTMSVECASVVSAFLCRDPSERLGARGAAAIKAHPFFNPNASSGKQQQQQQQQQSGKSGGKFPRAAPSSDGFNWPALESRKMKPPIDPMEGIEMSADDRDNTANFDPQFTNLQIESDVEGSMDQEQFEHFDGFSFVVDDESDAEFDDDDENDDDGSEGSLSRTVSRSVDSDTGAEIAVDASGKKVMMLAARKKGKEEVASEGDVFIDPKPMGVEAMDQEIRKLSSASSMASGSRPTSTDSLVLPPPPPPSYPHPDDLAAALASSSLAPPGDTPPAPKPPPFDNPLLTSDLSHARFPNAMPPVCPPVTRPAKPFEFVTCKMCGEKVEQSMDAIENHICST